MAEQPSLEGVVGPDFDWAGLQRVDVVRVPPPANGPILMIVAGLVVMAAAAGELGWVGIPLGLGTIGLAVGWWIWKKPTWQLLLAARSGESVPFESGSREDVERLAANARARLSAAGEV